MKRKALLFFLIIVIAYTVGCAAFKLLPPPFAPSPFRGVTIVLDPGHGGIATEESPTGGATGPDGLREPDVNLNVALNLKKLIEEDGARVYLTRSTDRRMTPLGSTYSQELHARVDVAVEKQADIFVSLHHNAPGPGRDPKEVNNTSTYVYTNPTAPERALAEAIQHNVAATIRCTDQGVFEGNFHVLRENPRQSVLVESSFITHPEEEERLRDTHYNYLEALGIYKGLKAFLKTTNIKKVPPKPLELEQSSEQDGYYIDHFVPYLYNPTKAEVDQTALYGTFDPMTGEPRRYICFAAAEASPVYAAGPGEVILVRTMSSPTADLPYKNCVVIRHDHIREGQTIYTVYGNLGRVLTLTNQQVTPETVIGLVGDPNVEETRFKFEVRIGENSPAAAENPELWIIHLQNRQAGIVLGNVYDKRGRPLHGIPIKGLHKIFGADKTPELFPYIAGTRSSSLWQENFAIADVAPNPPGQPYYLIIGDQEMEIEVQPAKVTVITLGKTR